MGGAVQEIPFCRKARESKVLCGKPGEIQGNSRLCGASVTRVCVLHTRIPWLYRNIHQFHHQHRQPFALSAQDASGAELLSLLLLAMASAWLVGCHPLSEAVFHLLNTWLAVEDHCGYDLPWALHRMLPFMGGAPYHQDHHVFSRGNYAPYFTHWDQLFGTYRPSVKEPKEQRPNAEERSVGMKDE